MPLDSGFPNDDTAHGCLTREDVEALLAAAPSMTLVAHVRSSPDDATPLLRGEPPFDRLRVTRLELKDTMKSAVERALAAAERTFQVPVGQMLPTMPVEAFIAPLADALRSSSSLTSLCCAAAAINRPPAALATVLGALQRHPTLNALELELRGVPLTADGHARSAVLTALCELVEANAPALTQLYFLDANLRDAELAPLMAALAHNTHLRVLYLGHNSKVGAALARDVLRPAVLAATALRGLTVGTEEEAGEPIMFEVQALLRARPAHSHA